MNIWKTRHYMSDRGGQPTPTANSKSLVQHQKRTVLFTWCCPIWQLVSVHCESHHFSIVTCRWHYTTEISLLIATTIVICSRNWVPGPDLVPKFIIRFQIWVITTRFSTAVLQNTTTFGLYLHLFTTLNSIVALMYFRLHIHKLHCSITRSTLVSETTNIISRDALTPEAVVFVTYFHYLLRSDGIWNRVWVPR